MSPRGLGTTKSLNEVELIIEGDMKYSILSSLSLLVASRLLRPAQHMTFGKEIFPIRYLEIKNTIISPLHTGSPEVGSESYGY